MELSAITADAPRPVRETQDINVAPIKTGRTANSANDVVGGAAAIWALCFG